MTASRSDDPIVVGDCLDTLRHMPDASVDAVVTDPPYGLGREPDPREVLRAWLDGEAYQPGGRGFMGKAWDAFVPSPLVWAECHRVLKPGGHLLAFAGSRTYDWIALGVRLAGFEVRDQLLWLYGSGFPKSHDVSKAIDRAAGAEREVLGVSPNWRETKRDRARFGSMEVRGEGAGKITAPATEAAQRWDGWGTALKPAHEPIVMARKPLIGTVAHNVTTHGTGAINVDACRVGFSCATDESESKGKNRHGDFGSAPPRRVSFGADNRTARNYDPPGRWPANIMHDGSPEVLAGFPVSSSTGGQASLGAFRGGDVYGKGVDLRERRDPGYGDTGTAARFFYHAKASRAERERGLTHREPETVGDGRAVAADNAYQRGATQRLNIHPTVKPVSVMRWLVRLVTPPGGTVLDPYAGSGTTGIAATLEGFDFVGCELSHEYADLARGRIAHARANPRQWEPDAEPLDEPNEDQLDMFT